MKISIIPLFLLANLAFGASYDTLPSGINTFVFKQVLTNKIESKYDANQSNKTLSINQVFNTSKLVTVSDAVNSYFNQLKELSQTAYNSFSLGEYEAKAWAQVNAQGFGVGHGITDHLTIYGSLPIYHMKTSINFYQKNPSNIAAIKSEIYNSKPTNAIGNFVKQLTLQLPDSNEELLQSVLVNYYHYKPLGTWQNDTLGDAELGMIYRFTDQERWGLSGTLGTVLPTGKADDADSLQDVSSGDGQTDAFVEANTGFNLFNHQLRFDLTSRYTYQFAANKKMRMYDDADVPLSDKTAVVREKLGNKLENTIAMTYSPTDWLSITTSYIKAKTGLANYDVSDPKIKKALESGTDTKLDWGKLSIGISTIEMYKAKKFEIPFEIVLTGQKLLDAKNYADYNRYDLDLKFYF